MLTEGGSMEYSIVLRSEEQYLIRAEARAHQGDLIGAKDDLNVVRQRAGLSDTPALTDVQIIAAVLDERRLEFFTEYGHRFFDLKRTNSLNSVLGIIKPGWNDTDKLLPLPVSELTLNPNLASAHYFLGAIALENGNIVEGSLAVLSYLAIVPDGKFSKL